MSSDAGVDDPLSPGQIRLRGVSRRFKLVHERNATLKETVLRRARTRSEDFWAVTGIDLDIAPGEAVGIVGRNGSGKSSLLKLLAGIIPPNRGTVEIGGTVAAMLELGAGFHPDFTGRENIYMNGAIYGLGEREVNERFDEIVTFAELDEFIDMPVRTYSSGMQMRLAFAISSHVNPDVLLLDEVLAVGDESFQRKCFGRIFEFRRSGGTLVFVSHDPAAVERVCDRAVVLADGVAIADGPSADSLAVYHRILASNPPAAHAARGGEQGAAGDRVETDDDPRQWGTREVVIRECRLLDGGGRPAERFLSGDPLTVELRVDAGHPVETPRFGVSIRSIDGALCYGTNSQMDSFSIDAIDGAATVRFEIPALALHEGRFDLTVGAASHDGSIVFHWLDRWIEFSVFPRATGTGLADLSGSWSIQDGAPSRPQKSPSPARP